MALYYGWFGMIANVALFFNLMLIALLSCSRRSLTLPGIAGIVLTVGMAVDANVLIYERIREELAAGTRRRRPSKPATTRPSRSIADANVTTLIAGVALFAFGTGPVKGFAVTLVARHPDLDVHGNHRDPRHREPASTAAAAQHARVAGAI